jgi:ribosomal protein L12E/L44/L45/RPP1/RPP2
MVYVSSTNDCPTVRSNEENVKDHTVILSGPRSVTKKKKKKEEEEEEEEEEKEEEEEEERAREKNMTSFLSSILTT